MTDSNSYNPSNHKVRLADEVNLLNAVALLYEKGIIDELEWYKKSDQIKEKYNEN